jgi:hypothetical protein
LSHSEANLTRIPRIDQFSFIEINQTSVIFT